MDVKDLLAYTKKQNASDLHLVSGHPPTLRLHGEIVPIKSPPIPAEQLLKLIHSLMNEKQRTEYDENLEIDFSVSFGVEARFRVNAFFTLGGPAAVLRLIPTQIPNASELNLPPIIRRLSKLSKGLVLVTGPTGSGKSTTLATILDEINRTQHKHIITIEDPVEFVHHSKSSLINQREIGAHTKSFSNALRSALREDPDVILVGELRDYETVSLALTAAETGHLVLATLHTNSAAQSIDRIIDVFPENSKEMVRTILSTSIEAIITQILVRKADGNGRYPVHDILLATSAVRNLIREGKIPQIPSIMQVNHKRGMQLLRDKVAILTRQGVLDKQHADTILSLEESELSNLGADSDEDDDQTLEEDF